MKVQIKSYLFSAAQRQITFSDYEVIDIDSVLYIINVTDNRAIYNPMNKNLKGSVLGNVLTLNYDTSLMSDTDELQIYYDNIPDPAKETTLQSIAPATDLDAGGKISVSTTPVEVTFTGTTKSIIITADKDNSGILYIGKSNVTSAGANSITFLEAGDSISMNYNDATNGIFVVSDAENQNFWKGCLI